MALNEILEQIRKVFIKEQLDIIEESIMMKNLDNKLNGITRLSVAITDCNAAIDELLSNINPLKFNNVSIYMWK